MNGESPIQHLIATLNYIASLNYIANLNLKISGIFYDCSDDLNYEEEKNLFEEAVRILNEKFPGK